MRQTFLARRSAALVAVVVLFLTGSVRADPQVYQKALRSTGWVIVPRDGEHTAFGTCWLADRERRLVVTCAHVVEDTKEVILYFPHAVDGEVMTEASYYLRKVPAINGTVVAVDKARDLALIRLRSVPSGIEPLTLAPRSARPGEVVHSIGNPDIDRGLGEGSLWWYTWGTVRQVYRHAVDTPRGTQRVRLLETQSPVNQGDSGGPVVDDQGRVVGVTHAYRAYRRLVSQNIDVQEVAEFLKVRGKPQDEEGPKGITLVGGWKIQMAEEEGDKPHGTAEFRSDGTFTLTSSKREHERQGRYAYANGVLWLMSEKGCSSVSLKWDGDDRFACGSEEMKLVFARDAK